MCSGVHIYHFMNGIIVLFAGHYYYYSELNNLFQPSCTWAEFSPDLRSQLHFFLYSSPVICFFLFCRGWPYHIILARGRLFLIPRRTRLSNFHLLCFTSTTTLWLTQSLLDRLPHIKWPVSSVALQSLPAATVHRKSVERYSPCIIGIFCEKRSQVSY